MSTDGRSEKLRRGVRRLPLRIAGVIGLATALAYLGVVIGQDDTSALALAVAWFVVMLVAGALAYHASRRGDRAAAMISGSLFIVLGLLSSPLFALVFLTAALFCAAGLFAALPEADEDAFDA